MTLDEAANHIIGKKESFHVTALKGEKDDRQIIIYQNSTISFERKMLFLYLLLTQAHGDAYR